MLLLLACTSPGLSIQAGLVPVETALRMPSTTFLWHAEDDACEGGRFDDSFLGVLDVAGDEAWFGGRSLGSLRAFADRNRMALLRGQRLDDPVGLTDPLISLLARVEMATA